MGSIRAPRSTTGLAGELARRQRATVPVSPLRRPGGRSSLIRLSNTTSESGDWSRDLAQQARTLAHWIQTRPAALAGHLAPQPVQAPLFAASEFGPGLR